MIQSKYIAPVIAFSAFCITSCDEWNRITGREPAPAPFVFEPFDITPLLGLDVEEIKPKFQKGTHTYNNGLMVWNPSDEIVVYFYDEEGVKKITEVFDFPGRRPTAAVAFRIYDDITGPKRAAELAGINDHNWEMIHVFSDEKHHAENILCYTATPKNRDGETARNDAVYEIWVSKDSISWCINIFTIPQELLEDMDAYTQQLHFYINKPCSVE